MAGSKRQLTVTTSPTAADELFEIWVANAKRYGVDHAQSYDAFLKSGIQTLATDYDAGKPVDGLPELRRLTLKRSRQGEGHVVVYQINTVAHSVEVHHVYHTRMDIQGRLESDFR